MPVATAPGSCELNKMLNRDWAIQVKPVGSDPSAYLFLRGIDSVNAIIETSAVDASDIDSGGWESQEKTSRKLTVMVKGKFARTNQAVGVEPSQRLLRETGEGLGAHGKIDVRVWRTDGDIEGWEFTATNLFKTDEGDANALRAFSAELQSSCAPRKILPVMVGGETKTSVPLEKVVKRVSLPNRVSGGTWTLSINNEFTSDLAHDISSGDLAAALEALDAAYGVVVTGSAAAGFEVSWMGSPAIKAVGTKLTGGESTTVIVI